MALKLVEPVRAENASNPPEVKRLTPPVEPFIQIVAVELALAVAMTELAAATLMLAVVPNLPRAIATGAAVNALMPVLVVAEWNDPALKPAEVMAPAL